jgi:DNA relaxase NicK
MPVTSMNRFRDAVDFVVSNFSDTAVWTPDQPIFMGIYWEGSGHSVKGIKWGWSLPKQGSNQPGLGFISVPGSVLETETGRDVWRTIRGLYYNWKFKATRIDIALDDYGKLVQPEWVVDALNLKDYARFRDYRMDINGGGKFPGWTFYFGSKKSDRIVRYYNKFAESKGKINAYRWELQLRGSLANAAFKDYAEISSEDFDEVSPTYLASTVTGACEFVNKDESVRLSRLERLWWWQKLVDLFGQVRHSKPKIVKTVDRTINWIRRQVVLSLIVLDEGLGLRESIRFLRGMKAENRERLTREHEALISQLRKERTAKDWLAA